MFGTIVNSVAIVVGAFLGGFLKGRFPDDMRSTLMQGLSLVIMLIGITMAINTGNLLVVTFSIVIGGIIGELLKIEERLNVFGERIKNRFTKQDDNFTRAFVSASLIYCVGAMAIMGAIQSGITGDHSILYIKSMLDGVTSIVFSSSLGGVGVAFSAVPVFLYQGFITVAAKYIKRFINDIIIREMTATGGLLILGIGINMLESKVKIKVGNLLPAVFIAVLITLIFAILGL